MIETGLMEIRSLGFFLNQLNNFQDILYGHRGGFSLEGRVKLKGGELLLGFPASNRGRLGPALKLRSIRAGFRSLNGAQNIIHLHFMFKLHTFLNTQSSYKVGNTSAVSKKKPWDKLPNFAKDCISSLKSLNKLLPLARF